MNRELPVTEGFRHVTEYLWVFSRSEDRNQGALSFKTFFFRWHQFIKVRFTSTACWRKNVDAQCSLTRPFSSDVSVRYLCFDFHSMSTSSLSEGIKHQNNRFEMLVKSNRPWPNWTCAILAVERHGHVFKCYIVVIKKIDTSLITRGVEYVTRSR